MELEIPYFKQQIMTYIGNKRKLLQFLGEPLTQIQDKLAKDKLDIFDGFSGSGIVSRFFKQFASSLYVNDLELYAEIANQCYLANQSSLPLQEIEEINHELNEKKLDSSFKKGLIAELYAPKNDQQIRSGERVFYTNQNANIIDNIRRMIEPIRNDLKPFFLAPLLVEASIHTNTSGVFKGFYKNSKTKIGQFGGDAENCLSRIKKEIVLPMPLFSPWECDVHIMRGDTNTQLEQLPPLDIAYYDPPYNQHPYGSNYFMLNVIATYQKPKQMSSVSGIPTDWNRSDYNRKKDVVDALEALVSKTPAKFILISYNNEGFVQYQQFVELLSKYGKVSFFDIDYNTFRGSRNLKNRSKKVKELLFMLEK